MTEAACAQSSATAKVIASVGHSGFVLSVQFSPDERFALSGSDDGTIKLWDLATGTSVRTILTGMRIVSVAFSPDGRRFIAGADYGTHAVRLWDVATGALLRTFEAQSIESVSFSPDGSRAWLRRDAGTMVGTKENLTQIRWGSECGTLQPEP